MKLFSRYNRINLLSTVAIFIAGSIVFSLLIRYVVNNQTDKDLLTERNEVTSYVKENRQLPEIEAVRDEYTTYKMVAPSFQQNIKFYTQKRWNPEEHDGEFVRSIEWSMQAGSNNYLITISKSLDVTEDLIESIIIITIALILLILMAGLLINRVVLKKLWQPFYRSVERVQRFKLNDTNPVELEKSSIDEFNLMNTALQNALNKARNDYYALKEFTENASHELQTPLAVISSKLDVIIQSDALTQSQSEAVSSAYEAIRTLKKLNQSLLLLAKIENRQFNEKTSINLSQLLEEKQRQFTEQLQNRTITCRMNFEPITISGNRQLMDILLNNLLSNAIRYNVPGGFISVQSKSNSFEISNSGKPQPLDEQYIFNRFYKGNSNDVHHGLGLSIIKQICDTSGYTCQYRFRHPDIHSFNIVWRNED